MSESEQEYAAQPPLQRSTVRRHRHEVAKKPSVSDFESSYAANVATRHLSRRSAGAQNSRIPGPVGSSIESSTVSRRQSPDKRAARADPSTSSPPPISKPLPGGSRTLRRKASARNIQKDKAPSRPSAAVPTVKPQFRRPPQGAGSKVSNIARHFERMNRDNERANRRYAVIRGRKARPVASARATVEVLDSIKDAIQDESESSDSSSEADDEGGDEDEARKPTDTIATESSPEQSVTLPTVSVQDAATVAAVPVLEGEEPSPAPPSSTPPLPPPAEQLEPSPSFPPSPFLTSQQPGMNLPPTPPQIDEMPGRSLFKQAFQGLSQGLFSTQFPPRRSDPEAEDPFNDPEHIFRDSSMVVRTDEPTSIIALALK